MNYVKVYDYLVSARQLVFQQARSFDAEQYVQQFPIGSGCLASTLTHMLIAEWYYIVRMQGLDLPPNGQRPVRSDPPPPFAELESIWNDQAATTRAALAMPRDWDAEIEYTMTNDDGRDEVIGASAADIFTQLILHEAHHRAQSMNMLRQLGSPVEDLDFNSMTYRRRFV